MRFRVPTLLCAGLVGGALLAGAHRAFPSPAPSGGELTDLAWLSGTWTLEETDTVADLVFPPARGDAMTGVFRRIGEGRVVRQLVLSIGWMKPPRPAGGGVPLPGQGAPERLVLRVFDLPADPQERGSTFGLQLDGYDEESLEFYSPRAVGLQRIRLERDGDALVFAIEDEGMDPVLLRMTRPDATEGGKETSRPAKKRRSR